MTNLAAVPTSTLAGVDNIRLTFPRVLRGEWIKLRTLRSTWWSIGIVAVLTLGMGILIAFALRDVGAQGFGAEPIRAVLAPIQFVMLLAGILGAISVTGEYSTGMIRSTLTATPSRGAVLLARSIVVGVFVAVSSLLIFVVTALVVSPIMSTPIDWADPEASTLPILTAAAGMGLFALLGVGFGFLLRSGAGAISATVGVLFVLPIVISLAGMLTRAEWLIDANNALPSNAIQGLLFAAPEGWNTGTLWVALLAWPAAALIAGFLALRSRDA